MKRICRYTNDREKIDCWDLNDIVIQSTCGLTYKRSTQVRNRHIGLILLSLVGLGFVFGAMFLSTSLNTSFNPTTLNLTHYQTTLVFEYMNGNISNQPTTFTVDIQPDASIDRTVFSITIGTDVISFECNYTTGHVIDTDYYPFFWMYLENNLLNGNFREGLIMDVVDPIGFLGPINAVYTIKTQQKIIYWTFESKLGGPQLAFSFTLYNSTGQMQNVGVMDITSGILMGLEGQRQIKLIDPGIFPVSRHRNTGFPIVICFIIFIPLISYVWKRDIEIGLLLFLGNLCAATDIYIDIWMAGIFGTWGLLILHFMIIGLFYIFGSRYKIGMHWITPPIIELGVILFISFITHTNQMIPYISIIPGSFIGFIFLVIHVVQWKKMPMMEYQCPDLPAL